MNAEFAVFTEIAGSRIVLERCKPAKVAIPIAEYFWVILSIFTQLLAFGRGAFGILLTSSGSGATSLSVISINFDVTGYQSHAAKWCRQYWVTLEGMLGYFHDSP